MDFNNIMSSFYNYNIFHFNPQNNKLKRLSSEPEMWEQTCRPR